MPHIFKARFGLQIKNNIYIVTCSQPLISLLLVHKMSVIRNNKSHTTTYKEKQTIFLCKTNHVHTISYFMGINWKVFVYNLSSTPVQVNMSLSNIILLSHHSKLAVIQNCHSHCINSSWYITTWNILHISNVQVFKIV